MASLTAVRHRTSSARYPGGLGLAETWYVARPVPGTLVAVPGAIFIQAGAVRLILVTG